MGIEGARTKSPPPASTYVATTLIELVRATKPLGTMRGCVEALEEWEDALAAKPNARQFRRPRFAVGGQQGRSRYSGKQASKQANPSTRGGRSRRQYVTHKMAFVPPYEIASC